MILLIAVSPTVIIAAVAMLILVAHISAGALIALAAIGGASLVLSLVVVAFIAGRSRPGVRFHGLQLSAQDVRELSQSAPRYAAEVITAPILAVEPPHRSNANPSQLAAYVNR